MLYRTLTRDLTSSPVTTTLLRHQTREGMLATVGAMHDLARAADLRCTARSVSLRSVELTLHSPTTQG